MVPAAFTEIVGQGQAIQLLTRAIACDRIAPAYLFVGPPGVGRAQVARGFLDLLISEGTESTQQHLRQENHPDILWIEPTYSIQGKTGDGIRASCPRGTSAAIAPPDSVGPNS